MDEWRAGFGVVVACSRLAMRLTEDYSTPVGATSHSEVTTFQVG